MKKCVVLIGISPTIPVESSLLRSVLLSQLDATNTLQHSLKLSVAHSISQSLSRDQVNDLPSVPHFTSIVSPSTYNGAITKYHKPTHLLHHRALVRVGAG